ncbi:tRNA (uridine(54)-C5)-methyltransferase TrmA [Cardiobacterium sp. Marseille-Q4385]|uniref:tRNA (uridine(54)-C5)-methyltransferase TrmA n=1 Tax=Cardiobacterium sp. Marseille-Q4385 TaxID=2866573 RepID=UPI001CE49251|nr:tRNA (uridine(54)-C5)-methyltransferase TrmA [Cardiobacterium sp. Marseille-Q4385]
MPAYQSQLAEKTARLAALLAPFAAPPPAVHPSPPTGYRMRAEFRVWHDGDDCYFAMTNNAGERIRCDNFPPACDAINRLMTPLMAAIRERPVLRYRLFQAEFHAAQTGEVMVSLVYHRPLDDAWQAEAQTLAAALSVSLIGRARKQKIILGRDFVQETFHVGGQDFHYRQYENSFSQPNAAVCAQMLAWACQQAGNPAADLLELYCGNGNFTLPLAKRYRRVLATEVSKSGIRALRENLLLNECSNIAVARLSAAELSEAMHGERPFRRLQQDGIALAAYDFDTVFVDPPRAGVDDATLALLARFPRILYISCNPETLAANLAVLDATHRISACALFDQFPFTPHIESGVLLVRR